MTGDVQMDSGGTSQRRLRKAERLMPQRAGPVRSSAVSSRIHKMNEDRPLCGALLAGREPSPAWTPSDELEAALTSVWETVCSAWPDIELSASLFIRHLSGHLVEEDWRGQPREV